MKNIVSITEVERLEEKKLVLIEWIKAETQAVPAIDHSWGKFETQEEEERFPSCFSAGYVTKNKGYYIRLVPNVMYDRNGELVCSGCIAIPKNNILNIKELGEEIRNVEKEEQETAVVGEV